MGSSMRCTSGGWATLRRSVLCVLVALAPTWSMAQPISDVPLAVKNNVPPNLMFMLDNSGSMSNIVPTSPYRDTLTIDVSTSCTPGQIIAPSAGQIDINISAGVPRFTAGGSGPYTHGTVVPVAPAGKRCFNNAGVYLARLFSPVGSYLPAEYTGHYLNWYFGTYDSHPGTGWTDRKKLSAAAVLAGGTVLQRMQIAKTASKAAIDALPLFINGTTTAASRLGLSTYNNGNGGMLVAPAAKTGMGDISAPKVADIKTAIDTLTPTGNTPLAETLADIGRYMATGWSGNVSAGGFTNIDIDAFLRQSGGPGDTARNSCLNGAPSCSVTSDAPPLTPSTGTPSRPIQYWCQRSYVFMMTDGRPQGDQNFAGNTYLRDYDGDCSGVNSASCVGGGTPSNYDRKIGQSYESAGSDYLDDVAKALYDVDLRPNLPKPAVPITVPATPPYKNNLRTYMIGFAERQVKNDPLMQRAATQGGGKFLTADDTASLTAAFKGVIADAFDKDAAASAVAVSNAQITVDSIGYASSYQSGSWYGELEAYSMDTLTGLRVEPALWKARDLLQALAPTQRKIVSFNGSNGGAFTAANLGTFDTSGATPLTAGVIDYLRGDRSGEAIVPPATLPVYRPRQFVLGDIINAEPVVATYSGSPTTPIIYQGANDGMLHVFDGRNSGPTKGQELWAYVPRLLHRKLAQLASLSYDHKYFVDGTPAITDIGSMRLLVGGLGKGGAGYYALNVTDYAAATEAAAAAKVKWEFMPAVPANMGYSFGTPLIVNTASGWRVVVASGYGNGNSGPGGNGDGKGYVWVLDPATGTTLATMTTGVGDSTNPSGLAHLSRLANDAPDAVVRYVYGGDLLGNVWRFDLNTSAVVKIANLTDGSGNYQPVTVPPTVGPVSGSSSKLYVYVGTGRYLADADVPGNTGVNSWATQRQTQYGIIDDTANLSPSLPTIRGTNGSNCPTGGGDGNFVCQSTTYVSMRNSYATTNNAVDISAKRGWYIDLPADTRLTNGRMTTTAALTAGGTLAYSVNVPTNLKCEPGGSSWFFALDASSGGSVPDGSDFFDAGSFLGGALASRPVIVVTLQGKRALIRMSDKTIQNPVVPEKKPPPPCAPPSVCTCPTPPCPPPPDTPATWKRIYWRPLN